MESNYHLLFLKMKHLKLVLFLSTPLHYACSGPFMQCILTLLTNGAKLDVINSNGCTALMYTCAFDGDSRAVRTLLAGRANPTITDKFGYNALHYASLRGNKKVFELVSCILPKILTSFIGLH